MREQYKPSQNEINEAEAKLSPSEIKMSKMRKETYYRMENINKEGFIEKREDDAKPPLGSYHFVKDANYMEWTERWKEKRLEKREIRITGNIGGYTVKAVKFFAKDPNLEPLYTLYVDGEPLGDSKRAEQFFQKYESIAYDRNEEERLMGLREQEKAAEKKSVEQKVETLLE